MPDNRGEAHAYKKPNFNLQPGVRVAHFCAGLFPKQGCFRVAVDVQSGRVLARAPIDLSPQGYLVQRGESLVVGQGRAKDGVVARLERRVGPFVGGREFPAAELLGALDPPEPGVEALGTPGLGLLGLDGLGFPVLLVEHGDVDAQWRAAGIDADSIAETTASWIREGK